QPLTSLAALNNALQPNTLIRDEPITFPPVGGGRGDSWSPKNYEGGSRGIITLRQALENSRNLATVHLLEGGIEAKPEQSLDRLCALALEMKIYRDCVRYYPFVLGARPIVPPSTSSRPCCRAFSNAVPPAPWRRWRPMWRARPAPPRTRTTPGSSASPTISRSRCGWATTTPATPTGRSARARPGPRS